MKYEVWVEVQASHGRQESMGTPTVRQLEYAGGSLLAAAFALERAEARPEVLSAELEVEDEG